MVEHSITAMHDTIAPKMKTSSVSQRLGITSILFIYSCQATPVSRNFQ